MSPLMGHSGTGCPGVSILQVDKTAVLIIIFYVRVATGKVKVDWSMRYCVPEVGRRSKQDRKQSKEYRVVTAETTVCLLLLAVSCTTVTKSGGAVVLLGHKYFCRLCSGNFHDAVVKHVFGPV